MWAREDIPSNKIIEADPRDLSNTELLSILIGTGSSQESSVELSRRILATCDNKLQVLAKKSPEQLTALNGVGRQKAARIMAAIELGKRRSEESAIEHTNLATATRVYNYMVTRLADLDVEEFWAIYLNQGYRVIKRMRISRGGISEVSVDVRIIMREAVLCNATCLVICHNHPSGSIAPSKTDDDLTRNIRQACNVMSIHFQDHVIVTDGAYYSYHEQGKL